MKKILIGTLFVLLLFKTEKSYSQTAPLYLWGTGLDGSTYQKTAIYSDINDGLLFEAPLNNLDQRLPITFSWRGGNPIALKISPEGNVGIGNTNPGSLLSIGSPSIRGTINVTGSTNDPAAITITDSRANGRRYTLYNGVSSVGNLDIFDQNAAAYRFTIGATGNIGIGTTTPQEKLSVNGKIRAQEIKVETTNWPDYVFKDDYKPQTLEELERFIKANKHLPEIPKAAEVEENGISLGEMNKLLLKKVEELTLFLIEKDKKMNALEERLKKVEVNQK